MPAVWAISEREISESFLVSRSFSVVSSINSFTLSFLGAAIINMGLRDSSLEGAAPDVLIIGGGISGANIARELSRWQLDILLVEKEADLAVQSSGRNDGEVHPGVDLRKGSLKQEYVLKGNRMYDQICEELDVPFRRCGQYVGFTQWRYLPVIFLYVLEKKYRCKVKDTRLVGRKAFRRAEPEQDDGAYQGRRNAAYGG